jgi:hypothetical protein
VTDLTGRSAVTTALRVGSGGSYNIILLIFSGYVLVSRLFLAVT